MTSESYYTLSPGVRGAIREALGTVASRITLRQLEYCVAVGDSGSIAVAAERIHVSPSSISAAVTHVESELQADLFVRHHAQGLSVTPVGRHVLREARQILDLTSGLYTVAAEVQNSIRGPLRVGCLTTLASMVIPELTQNFVRAHTGVQLSTVEDHQEGLFDRLRYAEIDIAITYDLQIATADIEFEALAKLPPHAVVSERHPLAKQNAVTLEELVELPMVLLDLPLSSEYLLSLFHDFVPGPQIAARSKSPEVVRSLVANDAGYAIANVRPRTQQAMDGRKVVMLPLAGHHRPMQLGLACPKGRRVSSVVEAFQQCCRATISDQYVPGMTAPFPDVIDKVPPKRRPRKLAFDDKDPSDFPHD